MGDDIAEKKRLLELIAELEAEIQRREGDARPDAGELQFEDADIAVGQGDDAVTRVQAEAATQRPGQPGDTVFQFGPCARLTIIQAVQCDVLRAAPRVMSDPIGYRETHGAMRPCRIMVTSVASASAGRFCAPSGATTKN